MKKSKIVSIIVLIIGTASAGVIYFANTLGLDNYAGWGRFRILAFATSLLLVILSMLYLLFSKRIDELALKLRSRLGNNSGVSRLLNGQTSHFLREYWFTLPIAVVVIFIYIWLISEGTWFTWVSPTHYYADLARGFERGKLFMALTPDPKLVALANPYDPPTRKGIDVPPDVTYYHGRYYLYWGPVPSLLVLPFQSVLNGRVGDLQLTFAFSCGTFLLLVVLIVSLWDQFFHALSGWMLGISVFLIGMANPALFMLSNFKGARIYEAAITGGQFFLVGGLLAVVTSLKKTSSYGELMLAGALWALSVGTRLFLVLPIGVLSFILLCSWLVEETRWAQKIGKFLSLAIPLALGAIALGWYNWARFGSVTESGLYYQLAGINLQENYNILIRPIYFIQNLYNYFIQPFWVDLQFPFVIVRYGNIHSILPSHPLPQIYLSQQITGLLPSAPFVVFALIPFILLLARRYKDPNGRQSLLYWIVLMALGSFLAAALFLMLFFWTAMRYLDDFMPSLLILSVIGFWQGYAFFAPESIARKRYAILGTFLAGFSILISFLLAVSINDARFEIIRLFTF